MNERLLREWIRKTLLLEEASRSVLQLKSKHFVGHPTTTGNRVLQTAIDNDDPSKPDSEGAGLVNGFFASNNGDVEFYDDTGIQVGKVPPGMPLKILSAMWDDVKQGLGKSRGNFVSVDYNGTSGWVRISDIKHAVSGAGGGASAQQRGAKYEQDLAGLSRLVLDAVGATGDIDVSTVEVPNPAGSGAGDDLEIRQQETDEPDIETTVAGPTGKISIEAKTSVGAAFGQTEIQFDTKKNAWFATNDSHPTLFKPFVKSINAGVLTKLNKKTRKKIRKEVEVSLGVAKGQLTDNDVFRMSDNIIRGPNRDLIQGPVQMVDGPPQSNLPIGMAALSALQKEVFGGVSTVKVPGKTSDITQYYGTEKKNHYIQISGKGLYDLGLPEVQNLTTALKIPSLTQNLKSVTLDVRSREDRIRAGLSPKFKPATGGGAIPDLGTADQVVTRITSEDPVSRLLVGMVLHVAGALGDTMGISQTIDDMIALINWELPEDEAEEAAADILDVEALLFKGTQGWEENPIDPDWPIVAASYHRQGKSISESTDTQVRLFIRETLINEELTKSDKKEIDRLIKKGIEKDRSEQKKLIRKEIEDELKKSLGVSYFMQPGKIRKAIEDVCHDQVARELKKGGDIEKAVVEITKSVLQAWHDLLHKQKQLINRIKV